MKRATSELNAGRCRKGGAGFTLLEIMVALAVLALSGIALLNNVNQATRNMTVLNDKTEALNIAEYTLNGILVDNEYPPLGNSIDIVRIAQRDWQIQIQVGETGNDRMRRVDVTVQPYDSERGRPTSTSVLLSGFVADLEKRFL